MLRDKTGKILFSFTVTRREFPLPNVPAPALLERGSADVLQELPDLEA